MARQTKWNLIHGYREHDLIPQFRRIADWVFELAVMQDLLPWVPRTTWTAPPIPSVDPEKEGRATALMVRAGLKSQPEAIREQGHDPILFLEEVEAFNEEMDRRGITFDSDPRKVNQTGQPASPADPALSDEPKPKQLEASV
jgi:capsid protein